jgi:hypothetical protein
MTQTAPYHSLKDTDSKVHHTNVLCEVGSQIEVLHLALGTGGLPLCNQCKWLADIGK